MRNGLGCVPWRLAVRHPVLNLGEGLRLLELVGVGFCLRVLSWVAFILALRFNNHVIHLKFKHLQVLSDYLHIRLESFKSLSCAILPELS